MSGDFFDRLEGELSELTRQGAHLTVSGHGRPFRRLVRRGLVSALVAVALAASLISEFPATASGHGWEAQRLTGERL
jgi:hypothetical protein